MKTKKWKILIVDDHPVLSTGLRLYLEKQEHFSVCGEAASEPEALDAIRGNMPDVVLGPPHGRGAAAGSTHVVSLGLGGSITLEMGFDIVDGPGPDFIVFENPFTGFVEPGQVAVSADGVAFEQFPCASGEPYQGCAGINFVYASPDNDIDPTDPSLAGGDAFDLADLGAERVRYLRITDVGGVDTGGGMAGFDLDSVVAVHAAPSDPGSLVGPDQLGVLLGHSAPLRLDLQTAAQTHQGVRTECQLSPAGIAEALHDCSVLSATALGSAQLTARLGDMTTTVQVHVVE